MRLIADFDAAGLTSQQRRVFEDEDTIAKPYRPSIWFIHEQRVVADVTVFTDFESVGMYTRLR